MEIFVGIGWAEAHHDICVMDEPGTVLAKRRIAEGLEGVGQLHALLADHATEPSQVVIGIETDRGLLVGALLAADYQVYAINPLAATPAVRRSRRPLARAEWSWPAWRAIGGWPMPATSGPFAHWRVGARDYYHLLRQRDKTHHQALRALANRLVGILHGCLDHRQPYREEIAWPRSLTVAA